MAKVSVSKFAVPLKEEVENHSIYVWGGSGQLCKSVTEEWIRRQEKRNQNGKHADQAVAAWKAVMSSQYRDVARVFDCSGYVSWCLSKCGAFTGRTNCDGLYDRCAPADDVFDGTLLFRVNPDDPNDETHVGVYFGGKQYHSKGRLDGVVSEPYNAKYWAKLGWFKSLTLDTPQPIEQKKYVRVKGKKTRSVCVRAGIGKKAKLIHIAHGGDEFPFLGRSETEPHWYRIDFNGRTDAWITNGESYTEVIYHA